MFFFLEYEDKITCNRCVLIYQNQLYINVVLNNACTEIKLKQNVLMLLMQHTTVFVNNE